MIPTEKDVKQLEQFLAENPTDTNIMNALALGYFENPSLVQDNEDLKLLERAYQTKKTIKSTHNLAWYYYMEFGATLEEAIKIQQECISMSPKSFYPYFLYGCMLLQNNQYSEAIKYLEIAYSKEQKRDKNLQ
ncbi:tetratricopeptide repeat protein [Calothrix sp. CCY 0018]|uniref:tetratricopeptide repeat protein n=1 Tax=Calothrix sp. CCY 0018 TaxID=3103864 RepID=UPI0039C6FD21